MDVRPVTPERWKDLEGLFGPNGAYANCWCMWWRMASRDFDRTAPAEKRLALRRIVRGGGVPGLLAYEDGDPVGWVSIAPREEFGRLERSTTLKRVDERPVWSVVCFYIPRPNRGRGIAGALVRGAVAHARERGARIVEAYPQDTSRGRRPAADIYTGVPSLFERAGFRQVARAGSRSIMRKALRRAAG